MWEWAHEHVRLFPPWTITGPFSVAHSPHFKSIFTDLQVNTVHEVNVRAPTRSAKSLIGQIFLAHKVFNDPGTFKLVLQSKKVAHEEAETKTFKLLRSIPGFDEIKSTDRHKTRENEIILPSGQSIYVSGPSLSELQAKGYRYMHIDEMWMEEIAKNIGEIKARLGDARRMGIDKLLCTAQGSTEGDVWDIQHESGEQFRWFVPCQACGQYQELLFQGRRDDGTRWGIVWESHKDDRGLWVIDKVVPTIAFECFHCQHHHQWSPVLRETWLQTGRWESVGTLKSAERHSYAWNAFLTERWDYEVMDWLTARNTWASVRDERPTRTFIQKRLANQASSRYALDVERDYKRVVFEADGTWPDEVARFLLIDRQQEDVFWVLVIAFNKAGRARKLWFGKVHSFDDILAVQVKWKIGLGIDSLSFRPGIDSGFQSKSDRGVYAACIKYDWVALKGVGFVDSFAQTVKRGDGSSFQVQRSYMQTVGDSETPLGTTPLIRFSSDTMNDKVQGLIDSESIESDLDPSDPVEREFWEQVNSEIKVRVRKQGKFIWQWQPVDTKHAKANHARDLLKMACLYATLAGVWPDPFELQSEQTANEKTAM